MTFAYLVMWVWFSLWGWIWMSGLVPNLVIGVAIAAPVFVVAACRVYVMAQDRKVLQARLEAVTAPDLKKDSA